MIGEMPESTSGFSIKLSVILRLSWLPVQGERAPIEVRKAKVGQARPGKICVVMSVRDVSS